MRSVHAGQPPPTPRGWACSRRFPPDSIKGERKTNHTKAGPTRPRGPALKSGDTRQPPPLCLSYLSQGAPKQPRRPGRSGAPKSALLQGPPGRALAREAALRGERPERPGLPQPLQQQPPPTRGGAPSRAELHGGSGRTGYLRHRACPQGPRGPRPPRRTARIGRRAAGRTRQRWPFQLPAPDAAAALQPRDPQPGQPQRGPPMSALPGRPA